MKETIIFILAIITTFSGLAFGQVSISLDDAKALSIEHGKPLLMEFVRED